jgi:sulfotransferase
MSQTFHAISGLPRSGSTLLSAILRQNPRFHAAMTSPVALLAFSLIPEMSPPAQFAAFFDDARRRALLRGLFHSYYAGTKAPVIFDTNRVWTGNLPLLADLFPNARVICCVREIGWIIDSVERALRQNPLLAARIYEGRIGLTLPARVEILMNQQIGLIGGAWSNLREAWFGEHANRLLLISYEGLVRDPATAISRLYDALGEPKFSHDFNNIAYDASEYDTDLGAPGLHRVATRITPPPRLPSIPPDIFNRYTTSAFWRTEATGRVVVC